MICNKCGNQIPDGSKFCEKCGATLDGSGTAVNNQPVYGGAPAPAEPKKKNTKLIIGIIAALVVIVIVIVIVVNALSGPSLSVDDVKSGTLTSYSSTTIGNAFGNYSYFDNTSWEEFDGVDDDGNDVGAIVEFDATLQCIATDYDDYDYEEVVNSDFTIQFYQDEDMDDDEFGIWGIYIEEKRLDDIDFEDILYCIYNDEVFYLYLSDYDLIVE
ncbi:MAG: zinc ribbon domain-containing protein [Ruminococcus sp.]|nr:zinc ribbon domain-containing protein [Ruminococcus sp.]